MTRYILPLLAAFLLLPGPSRAGDLPRADPVPGGVAIVPLDIASAEPPPAAYYRGNRLMLFASDTKWQAVVGIPLSARPGRHTLQLKTGSKSVDVAFTVTDKTYKSQYITLKNKRMVTPTSEDLKRIARDRKRIVAAYTRWRQAGQVPGRFLSPVDGVMTSTFGLRRFFNKQPRSPHSGLDIAAPRGTPVRAPAAGRVTEVGNYYFNGNTVFLDHGQGLVSMYCHLDRVDVAVGDTVERGEAFAKVGSTGRVTGPHLHWSVSLNNTRVDPSLFMAAETLARLSGAE